MSEEEAIEKLKVWPKHATLTSLCLEDLCVDTLISLCLQPGNKHARSCLQNVCNLELQVSMTGQDFRMPAVCAFSDCEAQSSIIGASFLYSATIVQ